jgi:hypothetical protein
VSARHPIRRCLSIAAALALAVPTAAPAASRDFFSSFEPADPQPAWVDTADKAAGVAGPARPPGIPGNQTEKVIAVRASDENAGSGEVGENLVDGSPQTKWLTFESTGWVEFEFSEPIAVVHYALTSANDAEGRDPRNWTLSGSNDGTTWTQLDEQSGQDFAGRFATNEYRFDNTTAYRHYRLDITANHGEDILQLAEVQLSDGDTTPPPPSPPQSRIGSRAPASCRTCSIPTSSRTTCATRAPTPRSTSRSPTAPT